MISIEALVLEAKNWGEADKMLTLFTAERGKITATAFGARRAKTPLRAAQLFNCIEADLAEGTRFFTLKQARLKTRHKKLSEDFETMAYGAFVAEMVRELWPENVPDAVVYKLLTEIFDAFDSHNPRLVALTAGWQLLAFTGYEPHLAECSKCGKFLSADAYWSNTSGGAVCNGCRKSETLPYQATLRKFILTLRDLDWQNPPTSLSGKEILPAENILLNVLQKIMDKPMKSLAFISKTLA